ncbi:branched-chain amino acid transport system substrate-binding protein [Bradyrhizobium diazoefficiens]
MRSTIAALGMIALLLTHAPVSAQGISGDVVKIGIMNDQNGPYADNCGLGSVAAAKLAVGDFGGAVNGKKIELVIADDQNKPDVGVAIALRWVDNEGVDAIVGCSASSIYAQPKATVKALLAQGIDSWFFLTVDYAFGKAWQADATKFIQAGGGKVVGSVLHPLNSSDLSSFLLTAQASGAKAIALANSGADFANAIKQAQEFGLTRTQLLVPLGLMISQTHGIGLKDLQNVRLTTPFYWDMTPESRAFAKRYAEATNGQLLNEGKAATYSAITHYLKAVAAAGSDDGDAVMRQMKNTPINDFEMNNVSIRADGQVMRPLYVARIKAPSESKYTYDYYEITGTIAPEDAWRPASESACDLLKSQ